MDVVTLNYVQFCIIKTATMAIVEDHLGFWEEEKHEDAKWAMDLNHTL